MPIDRKRANAVARVIAGESTAADEAQRLGVSKKTVERAVKAAKAASGDVSPVVASQDVPPSGETPQDKPNEALEAALSAAGEGTATPDDAPTAPDMGQARADMETFCTDTYNGFRSAVGSTMVSFTYSPPLDPTSPEVLKLLRAGPAALLAIKANAPRLYPLLVRWASGWAPLIVAIGTDTLGMFVGLSALAKSKGWKPPEKKRKEREEEYKPWVQTWTAPKPPTSQAPPEGIQTVDATNGPFGVVKDAPRAQGAA